MKIYGTASSPYVRRVRVVAAELGVSCALVDTTGEDGQKVLRAVSPVWKMPAAELDEQVLFDSHVIIDYLVHHRGHGALRPAGDRWREANVHTVIDTVLDSAINVRLMRLDGADPTKIAYLAKQRARVASSLGWIEGQLRGGYFTDDARLGLTELALFTALDWMMFREEFPVRERLALVAFMEVHAGRASLQATRPS